MAQAEPLPQPPLPAPRLRAGPVERVRVALGTWVVIEASAHSRAQALLAIEEALGAMSEVERLMHPVHQGSDLERINSAPPGVPIPIHRYTARVLALAQRLNDLTGGVFDPCLPQRPGRLSDLRLLSAEPEYALPCLAPVALDFGGIAKGFAVDRAVAALRAGGCSTGL